MSFLKQLTWKKFFLIAGLIIIWVIALFALFQALFVVDILTAGFAIIVGIVFSGILYGLLVIIDRFL
ncbi:MAG: hypothetical protein JSW11_02655 [Candidatus Heimdallarchaeota archaeon]|nr:MAG: hypothetical protein JSW11_02655 [Candidatus Heimdallarchaeota archaeon]